MKKDKGATGKKESEGTRELRTAVVPPAVELRLGAEEVRHLVGHLGEEDAPTRLRPPPDVFRRQVVVAVGGRGGERTGQGDGFVLEDLGRHFLFFLSSLSWRDSFFMIAL